MPNGADPSETLSLRFPWAFVVLLGLLTLALVATFVVMVIAFLTPGPLAEHQEDLLETFQDGFKVSLAAIIALVAGKITT